MSLRGAVLVCGTASDVGKSRIVAALCRVLARREVLVTPFKAQNMSLNSYVTSTGHEIARSQAHQALAARTTPRVEMNPILLKPTGEKTSQLVVMGRPVGTFGVEEFAMRKEPLRSVVGEALSVLRSSYDVVVAEGAGGAAEINLLEGDLVNLPLARSAELPAILVGDIERGGVFAALYGTVALLSDELRAPLRGFLINKFRGEKALLQSGIAQLEDRCGLPCLGVIPHLGALGVDAEDSLALLPPSGRHEGDAPDRLDVAVIALPHLSNFTDFDPLVAEPGVTLRYVAHRDALGDPDLVVLPGSKATIADLDWLRAVGLDSAIESALSHKSAFLGVCGGYQMLGSTILDDVESLSGVVSGLGWLSFTTRFSPEKCTRQRSGQDHAGHAVSGYEIHHGMVRLDEQYQPWFDLDGEDRFEGVAETSRGIFGTSLHGLFESDAFRGAFLCEVATRRGKTIVPTTRPFGAVREAEIDRFADALEESVDLEAIFSIIGEGAR